MDKEMYFSMNKESRNAVVDRGIALHKMIRLVTAATAGDGYLNFMGNEFGHPEWIDFPREGNGWSFAHARRLWSLARPDYLRYRYLRNFDADMVHFIRRERLLGTRPRLLVQDEEKKVLVFSRGNCIFAANFNATGSFADYGFEAPEGEYVQVLDSDLPRYDGFDRRTHGEHHFTVGGRLSLYLPSRTVLVLRKL